MRSGGRLAQPLCTDMSDRYPDKRTPASWTRNCLAILTEMNPGYCKNREVKGRFIEFVRELESGLLVSYNFIKIRDHYHLSFALLFTAKPTTVLYHPLMAGSRFDHNMTIWKQFNDHLGLFHTDPACPRGRWSFGPWRKNTMERLETGLRLPEEFLLPHYLGELRKRKSRLVALFQCAHELLDDIDISLDMDLEARTSATGADAANLRDYTQHTAVLDARAIALGGQCWYGFGPVTNTFRVSDVPIEAIILCGLEVFLPERDRLLSLAGIASRL